MNLKDYTLDKPFSIVGKWFLPGQNLSQSVIGYLNYTDEEIILDTPENFVKSDGEINFNRSSTYDYVFGLTQDGKTVVLHEVEPDGINFSTSGFTTTKYSVQDFFVFEINHTDNKCLEDFCQYVVEQGFLDLEIEELSFSFEHLNKWMNQSTLMYMNDRENNKISYISDMNTVQSDAYVVEDTVMFKSHLSVSPQHKNNQFIEEHNWVVVPHGEQLLSFEKLLNYTVSFTNLIKFFVNSSLKFNYLQLILKTEKNSDDTNNEFDSQVKGSYFFNQTGKRDAKEKKPSITYGDLKDNFQTILDNWFLKKDTLEFIINSYLGDLTLDYYVDFKLLNSIRCLEVYHRNFVEEPQEIDPKLEAAKEKLLAFVEENIEEEIYRNKFARNINYDSEMTLSKRLMSLFKALPEEMEQNLFDYKERSAKRNINSLVPQLVQTRNYYTHGDDKEKYTRRLKEPREMFDANQMLGIIMRYYIYLELLVDEASAFSLLKKDISKFRRWRS